MSDPRIRQLIIKTGVVKRLAKEKTVCEKEIITEQKRLERLKSDGADDHVLRKQQEVIQECEMMLPDAVRRLEKEYQILQKFLDDERELNESKEFELASQALSYAKEVMSHQI